MHCVILIIIVSVTNQGGNATLDLRVSEPGLVFWFSAGHMWKKEASLLSNLCKIVEGELKEAMIEHLLINRDFWKYSRILDNGISDDPLFIDSLVKDPNNSLVSDAVFYIFVKAIDWMLHLDPFLKIWSI